MIKKIVTIFLLLFIGVQTYADKPDDFLRPEVAFQGQISNVSADKITATWKIADKYYMYRKRFKFESDTSGISLGEAIFPTGKVTDDPDFGRVETYRGSVAVEIPLIREGSATDATQFSLKTVSQGCADAGICYPPQKKTLSVQLEALETPAMDPVSIAKKPTLMLQAAEEPLSSSASLEKSDLASQLGISGLSTGLEPLHPDKAFIFDLSAQDKNTLNARWEIEKGHYLYQNKIKLTLKDAPDGVSLGEYTLPKGKQEHDQYFGDVVIYYNSFDVKLPLIGNAESVTIKASYQGCSKLTGICYPPQHKTQTVDLSKASSVVNESTNTKTITQAVNIEPAKLETVQSETKVSEQDSFVNKMKNDSFFIVLGAFFLAGIALTFTPCVFPMIPILSGIIAGQGSDNNTRKSFFLSLSYVLAMALTYAIVGVIAAMSGENLQVALQNPWVIGAFAALFVLLSLSMFGFYELQMPASIQSKLTNISNSQAGGNILSAGIMGFLSALIVGPCVTAPLIGALIYIAQTNDMVLGGLSLFALGLGMGVPLLIIGTSAGKILPKAGAWMDSVKAAFGIMMLALAIWMLERILPFNIIVILTGILALFSGIYMGALDSLSEASTGWKRFFKATGLVVLIYAISLLIGAASGNASLLRPLKGFSGGIAQTASAPEHLVFKQIKGVSGLENALALAKQQNQTVMLDFYADWCISCKEMEHLTFTDKAVIKSLKNTLLIQADVTPNDEKDDALLKKFGLFGPPAILFFDKNSEENRPYRIVGYKAAEPFKNHVEAFLKTTQ